MNEEAPRSPSGPPPHDPVGETKQKLIFAAVVFAILLFLKFGLGW